MKKIYVLIAIAIIGILSWSTTVNANDNIIDLGTIKYDNIDEIPFPVLINSTIGNKTERVILTYMYSEIDKSAMFVKEPYLTMDNMTKYTFYTLHIEVDWWFKNDTKSFIYQDNNTKQLYRVSIDYADIEIPSNPVIEWMNKYNNSVSSFDELQDLFKITLNDLNNTREDLEARWLIYNQSKDDFDNKSILVETLRTELEELNIEQNETERLWISATANASTYESYYRNLWDTHEKLQQEHNDLSGIYPLYLFFAILGTSMIAIVFFKRKKILGLEEKSELEIERDTGYSPIASRIDKFTARILHKDKPENKQELGNPTSNPKPSESKTNIEDIYKTIDGLQISHDTFQESTVKDIQGIQKRVDVIETKLKITGA